MKLKFKLALLSFAIGLGASPAFAIDTPQQCMAKCNIKYNQCMASANTPAKKNACKIKKEDCLEAC